ncbi:hypothetical protein C8F04DRAFT_1227946 [Mycena alexandri]|uniref:Glucose receptor Git3 N-terminal domain-containing protein n=1 Tax=Mycena alexandri TaxID=1745969 RepID=A0AAD6TJ29_9AGAR|nr:hypothetical protein C8F04DRAFT_1227946 [Mycena alexandri]
MSAPPGVVCTLEEYSRSLSDPSIHCLTRGQSIGLTVTAESGLISLVAVLGVFTLIIRNGIRHVRRTGKWYLVRQPMDVLMLSLFVADLVQAVGAVMDVHWVHSGVVSVGSFCTAQGVVQQLGETSVAITTLLITLFTFAGVWFRKGSTFVATLSVAVAWLFVILMVGIGNATHRGSHTLFESPTPYWCWIGQGFLGLRLAGEYVWFWITLAVSVITYLTLFLWARGNITISDTAWWRFSVHRSSANADPADRRRRQTSYAMIAYPVCYSILLLPLSVVRWIGFVQERGGRANKIPSAATFGVISLYGLSGALNVVLLLSTKPDSMLFGDAGVEADGRGHGHGRAPSPFRADESASDFRARSRASRDSSLQLGRLPSASDGEWDLPKAKGVVH